MRGLASASMERPVFVCEFVCRRLPVPSVQISACTYYFTMYLNVLACIRGSVYQHVFMDSACILVFACTKGSARISMCLHT